MINVKDVSVIYNQEIKALDHLQLELKENQCTVIIGKNGSGKSTLLQTLVGIVDFQGSICIDHLNLDKDHLLEIRNKVGLVFQNPDHQLFMSTIYDDLAFGLINQGLSQEEIKQRIDIITSQFAFEQLLYRSSHRLSGGQKRMVAIACILIMRPDIILMDEPTSFLDTGSRRQVINILKDMHKTLIIASHDLDMALDIADEVILLNEGKVIAQGLTNDILTNQKLLEDNGLELPYRYQR